MTSSTGVRAREVVFVVQWLETFEVVMPVIRALAARGLRPRIVVTPERDILGWTSDGSDFDNDLALKVWTWLARNGFEPLPLRPPAEAAAEIERLEPVALFLPSPYVEHRHLSFAPDTIRAPVHYVNYGFNLWPPAGFGRIQFDLPFYRQCAAVYAENEFCADEYRRAGVQSARIVPSGHPALDHWDEVHGRSATPTILWSPWWSTENGGYSTFGLVRGAMLREAERRPHVRFIFRPHPLLWGQLRKEGQWTDDEARDFLAHVARLPNVHLDGEVVETTRYPLYRSHIRQFEATWAMVTDGVSFLAEFGYTGKPLLLTQAPGNQGWNEVGDAIASVVDRSAGADGLSEFLDRVERGHDPDAESRMRTIRSLFYRPAGGSASVIADHVLGVTSRLAPA